MLILLLEDHKPIRDMLKMALVRDKHEVLEAENTAAAKQIIRDHELDIAIVDWMLPDISGVEFIRWPRRQKGLRSTPVMMLTAKNQEAVTTVTVQIVTLLTGDQEFDSPKTLAAFALGLLLFVITLLLNLMALKIVRKYREQYE